MSRYVRNDNNKNLSTISLLSYNYITDSAFRNHNNLTTITGLNNITLIFQHAFVNCINLIFDINELKNVITIDNEAFNLCTMLKQMTNFT